MQKRHISRDGLLKALGIALKIYTLIFIFGLIFFAIQFFKEIHICPKGSLWNGQHCTGIGITPLPK